MEYKDASNSNIEPVLQRKGLRWLALGIALLILFIGVNRLRNSQNFPVSPSPSLAQSDLEYLWYEAENMRGISQTPRHEPVLNPSYLDLPAAKAPGWSISGPGVSAEWSQGGESEWNSVAASADATRGTIWQDLEIP